MITAQRVAGANLYHIIRDGVSTGLCYSIHFGRPAIEDHQPVYTCRILREDGVVFEGNAGCVKRAMTERMWRAREPRDDLGNRGWKDGPGLFRTREEAGVWLLGQAYARRLHAVGGAVLENCDHCGRPVPRTELKPVPSRAVYLSNNCCQACRGEMGWTDERLEEVWAQIRAQLGDSQTAKEKSLGELLAEAREAAVKLGLEFELSLTEYHMKSDRELLGAWSASFRRRKDNTYWTGCNNDPLVAVQEALKKLKAEYTGLKFFEED